MNKIRIPLLSLLFWLLPKEILADSYDILKYGAVSDTNVLSTAAVQKTIDECNAKGGGTVIVPAGGYVIGTIVLKSNVNLQLEAGAVLYGSRNLADYIKLKPAYVSLRTQESTIQLIYAESLENVSITGEGEIDGRGKNFEKLSWNDEGITRPHLMRFITCKNVLIENISLRNSGCWMQHYLACERLQVRGLRIYNHNNFNNDGIDIDGCKDVTVSDLISDSDDDGITLKSTSGRACENVSITNCVVSSHCNAIKLGTESNAGFKNIVISNCVVKPSSVSSSKYFGAVEGTSGLSLEIVDGGMMQGIVVSNISIEGTLSPLFVRLANRARPYKKEMIIDHVGSIDGVSISNIRIRNAGSLGCSVTGMPGHPVGNISFSNIAIECKGGVASDSTFKLIPEKEKDYPDANMFGVLPAYGFFVRHAANISFDNVELNTTAPDGRPSFYLDDVVRARLSDLSLGSAENNSANIFLHGSKHVLIQSSSISGKTNCFVNVSGKATAGISVIHNYLPAVASIVCVENGLEKQVISVGNVQ